MCQRLGGIQDISLDDVCLSPETIEVTVRYKVPYKSIGFSQEADFWEPFLGQAGAYGSILQTVKELLQKNAPFLEEGMHQEFGGKEVLWKWLNVPETDTRFYALEKCTPDLLQFSTAAEVKA